MQHADHAEEEVLAPDEAPTPMWLPLLGAALLLVAVIFFAATRAAQAPASAEGEGVAAEGAEPAPEAPAAEKP